MMRVSKNSINIPPNPLPVLISITAATVNAAKAAKTHMFRVTDRISPFHVLTFPPKFPGARHHRKTAELNFNYVLHEERRGRINQDDRCRHADDGPGITGNRGQQYFQLSCRRLGR